MAAAPFAESKVLSGHDARRAQFPDQLFRDEILRRHAGHRVVEMENKHGIGACGREQSLPLIQCRQAKGREVRKEMPYRMRIERGNDSGAAFRPRPLYRAPGHCLVAEMKPIEIDRKSTRLNSSH